MRRLEARARSLWRALRGSSDLGSEMDEEFRLHIELRAEHLVNSGVPPREAARRARLEFGSTTRYREEGREARGMRHIDELWGDLRYAARSLRRSPGFAAAAVLTLALGVGANSAVFSLVSASLLRPLPFAESERIVVLQQYYAEGVAEPRTFPWWSPAQFEALRSELTSFSELAPVWPTDVNLSTPGGEPARARLEIVASGYFPVLGQQPALGRAFLPQEDSVPGAHPVAVIGHDLWQRQLGGDAGILGRRIRLNGVPVTVIGVAPEGFHGVTGGAEVWIPQAMGPAVHAPDYLQSDQAFAGVIGKLRPGASIQEARAEVETVGARAAAAVREGWRASERREGEWAAGLVPLEEARRDPATVRARLVLAGAATFLLLIAAVNLSGLLLARASTRARETAARAALGATRLRLLRHATTEGGLLGIAGGVVGLVLASACVWGLAAFAPEHLGGARPQLSVAQVASFADPKVDWRVAAFAAAVALAAGVLSALLPALKATRGDLTPSLKAGGRGSSGAVGSLRRPTTLSVGAALQVGCSLVLLVGAGLLLRGFHDLRSVQPGFEPAGVLTFRLSPPRGEYEGDAAGRLHERLLARLEAIPGVRSATVGCPPFGGCGSTGLSIADRPGESHRVGWNRVGPDHFQTLGIPVLRGRALTAEDRAGRPRVAVINETAAQRLWPGHDPIGKHVWFGYAGYEAPNPPTEIVGIVGDVAYGPPGSEVRPDVYTSYLQFTLASTAVMVKAEVAPAALVPSLRRAVAEVDADLAIHDVRTMSERGGDALGAERFATLAVGLFALLGLLLASVGIYGIIAYSVAQRRREIGVRLALGATPHGVVRFIVRQGLGLAAVGLLVGGAAAVGLSRALPALIAGIGPADVRVFAAVVPLLLAAALLASYLPARRAARISPAEAVGSD